MEISISPASFFEKATKVYQSWNGNFSDEFDSILLVNGKNSSKNCKTASILTWLFSGYNFPDCVLAFTKNEVIFYGSERKCKFPFKIVQFLDNIKNFESKINLTLLKKGENNTNTFDRIWDKLSQKKQKSKIGVYAKEKVEGSAVEQFSKYLGKKSYQKFDNSKFFDQFFAVKDENQVEYVKLSSLIGGYFFKKYVKAMEKIIDEETSISHEGIVAKIENDILREAQLKKCAVKVGGVTNIDMNKDLIDFGTINIQSGGHYSENIFVEPDKNKISPDCIILTLNSIYQGFNAVIVRTFFINASKQQKENYKKAMKLMKILEQSIKPGVKLKEVFEKGANFLKQNFPQIVVPTTFGYGTGIHLTEPLLSITQNNKREVSAGNVFILLVSFTNLKVSKKTYSIQLSQIISVTSTGTNVLTKDIPSTLSDITYEFDEKEKAVEKKDHEEVGSGIRTRSGKRKEATLQNFKIQKKRTGHQMQLKNKKLQELKERILNENFFGEEKKKSTLDVSKINCYDSKESFPKDLVQGRIYVDTKKSAVLLPISNKHVPVSIHLIKSVVKSIEGKNSSLRFNFHLPSTKSSLNLPKCQNQSFVYWKQMVFRSGDNERLTELEKKIKAEQKKIKQQIAEKILKDDLAPQEQLKINSGKRPVLRDLFTRPSISTRKAKGQLQCHLNGFKFQARNQTVSICFSNIRYAFFQPCENEIIAVVHFKLYEPMIIGKKKCFDIQFYAEGGQNFEDVNEGRLMRQENDDDQERFKQNRKKLDKEFKIWIDSCKSYTANKFEFQIPKRNKGFFGSHYRQNSLLQPTNSCLINITEIPFFVCPLNQIQIVCFERIYANSRTFDITIIKNDYENFLKINAIPINVNEKVKNWFDECDIIFYEMKRPLNWAKFLSSIRKDFVKFVGDGGWLAWDEEEEESKSDQSFSESEYSEESSDSDDSSSEYEEENSDAESSEELSEEGLSSEALQEMAELQDRQRDRRQRQKFIQKKVSSKRH